MQQQHNNDARWTALPLPGHTHTHTAPGAEPAPPQQKSSELTSPSTSPVVETSALPGTSQMKKGTGLMSVDDSPRTRF
ncbi:uncharacterized protein EHS24_007584 [Apiotrichum porosum]|uniref:Uncharacterized protein n=1 Tax=Apiotrichum porosum TaxID=105984 RepID=A0A427XUS9_9TREE|nr:uncharacterized protein EHS24_007584 [Apiotrichum porosum]RSH82600.1 hypothetical protein EHS24_007584 [Apiotrichum porosum]